MADLDPISDKNYSLLIEISEKSNKINTGFVIYCDHQLRQLPANLFFPLIYQQSYLSDIINLLQKDRKIFKLLDFKGKIMYR